MAQRFTRENPPLSGTSARLWRWFTAQDFILPHDKRHKRFMMEPDSLLVARPGRQQRNAGAISYEITWKGVAFRIWEADEVLRCPIPDLDEYYYHRDGGYSL